MCIKMGAWDRERHDLEPWAGQGSTSVNCDIVKQRARREGLVRCGLAGHSGDAVMSVVTARGKAI